MKLLDETIPKTMAITENYMSRVGKADGRIALFFRDKDLTMRVYLFSFEKELLDKTSQTPEQLIDVIVKDISQQIKSGHIRSVEFAVMNCEAILTDEKGEQCFYEKDIIEAPKEFIHKEVILSYGLSKNGDTAFQFKEIQRIMNFGVINTPDSIPKQNMFQFGPLNTPRIKKIKYKADLLDRLLKNL